MTKEYLEDAVKISAEIGMDLIRSYDDYRSKVVYCPLTEEEYWSETIEIIIEESTP